MDSFSDSEFLKLSEKVKPLTWVLRMIRVVDDGHDISYATAFSLQVMGIEGNEIFLMTCAHALCKYNHNIDDIMVRRILDENFVLKADIVYMKLNWGIALLVVRGVQGHMGAKFATDGSISPCETLLNVGHVKDMVWSVLVVRAAYQCIDSFIPFNGRSISKKFHNFSLNKTPPFRILGHLWNKEFFVENKKKDKSRKFTFEKNLHPFIPIIQCSGFTCEQTSYGGPVYNMQGQIVGMMVGEFDGGEIAIHVTLLKEFIKEFVMSITQDSSKVKLS